MNGKARLRIIGALCLASGGFVGYFPVASGTAGSLVGAALVWGLRGWNIPSQVLVILLLGAAGVWASGVMGTYLRSPDSGRIVIDEIVGMLITMLGVPITGYWLVCGFVAFRFFDIFKLPPASYFDTRVKNGWGVMLDDGVAGVYANILLHLMLRATL